MTTLSAWIGTTYLGAGGTQIDATVGDWVRRFDLYETGSVQYSPSVARHIQSVGDQQVAATRPGSSSLSFEVMSSTTATTAGTDAREGAALDEWRLLNTLFKPYTGRQYLKVHRHTAAGADVLSVALVEVVDLPGARVGRPGGGATWLAGNIVYPVQMYRPYPFWWNATATATDTADVGAAKVTTNVTVPSGSVAKVGARITFKTVTGNSTKWLFENDTTGDEMTVLSAANVTDGEYVDWYHADKLGNADPLAGMVLAKFAANAGGENLASMWLVPGVNAISITRITGAGSCVFTVTFQEAWGSI
jgi:hypothetical protein